MPMLHDNTVQMQGVCGVCALRALVQNFDCILHFEVICQIVCYSDNNTITSNSVVFFFFTIMQWDTHSNERFHTITSAYFRGAMGVFVVFDTQNKASYVRY